MARQQSVETDGGGLSAFCVPGASPAMGRAGTAWPPMNLPWKLYPAARKWPRAMTERSSLGTRMPSGGPSSHCLSHGKHILNASLNYSCTRAVWCRLNLGLTDGEVGSPVGLERGFQRVLMFLRSPLHSANCGNTQLRPGNGSAPPGGGAGCFLIKELLPLGSDAVVCK